MTEAPAPGFFPKIFAKVGDVLPIGAMLVCIDDVREQVPKGGEAGTAEKDFSLPLQGPHLCKKLLKRGNGYGRHGGRNAQTS